MWLHACIPRPLYSADFHDLGVKKPT